MTLKTVFGPPGCWLVVLFWTELFESVVPVVFDPVPAGNGEPDAGDCIAKSWFCPGVVFCGRNKQKQVVYVCCFQGRNTLKYEKNKTWQNPLYIFDEVMHDEMRIFCYFTSAFPKPNQTATK